MTQPNISPLQAALLMRCPACGRGKLYKSMLNIADACGVCRVSFKEHEKGDGPAVFAILAVGFIVVALAGYVEFTYQPPYWVHAALWGPLIIGLSLYFIRFFKALIVAVQYRNMGL